MHPSAQSGRSLKIGVAGYGYWGPKLVRNFNQIPGVTLVRVADIKAERLEHAKRMHSSLSITQNFQDLLGEDIDALVIATPVNTHYELAREALLNGKHVLVEKPITANSAQARELIDLAAEKNLTLMVGHTFMFNPAVEKVREIVQAGELGDIFYLSSIRVNLGLLQPDINVMWDLAPHDLSLIHYILGSEAQRVGAKGGVFVNAVSDLHEVVYMTVIYENNVLANLRLSWLDPVKQRRLTVVGSKKMLVYDDIAADKVVLFDRGVEVPPYSVTEDEFHASYRHGGQTVVPLEWTEPLRVECNHFVECIQSGKIPRSNGEVGLKIVQILETAQNSLLNSGIELEILST